MTSPVRRGAAFGLVGSLALAVPLVDIDEQGLATLAAVGPFFLIAATALLVRPGGLVFELFAQPADRRDGRLYGLAAFALATGALAVAVVGFGLPAHVFAAAVLLLGAGDLVDQLCRRYTDSPLVAVVGFVLGGSLAGFGAQTLVVWARPPACRGRCSHSSR